MCPLQKNLQKLRLPQKLQNLHLNQTYLLKKKFNNASMKNAQLLNNKRLMTVPVQKHKLNLSKLAGKVAKRQ